MAAVTTADAVIRAALSANGQTEDPPGSNICPITRELDATFGPVPTSFGFSPRSGQSWCGSFTFWALWKGGYPIDPRGCLVVNGVDIWDFYTPADVNAWKRAGRWLAWDETPPPGALIYYDWQNTRGSSSVTDHVGLVIDVSPTGVISTIEGNTSPFGLQSDGGQVCTFGPGLTAAARPKASIVGYGLPIYAITPPTEEPMGDYLGLLPDGSYFLRGARPAIRVTGEELASVYAGVKVYTVPAGTNWAYWVGQELKAYDKAVA